MNKALFPTIAFRNLLFKKFHSVSFDGTFLLKEKFGYTIRHVSQISNIYSRCHGFLIGYLTNDFKVHLC